MYEFFLMKVFLFGETGESLNLTTAGQKHLGSDKNIIFTLYDNVILSHITVFDHLSCFAYDVTYFIF